MIGPNGDEQSAVKTPGGRRCIVLHCIALLHMAVVYAWNATIPLVRQAASCLRII